MKAVQIKKYQIHCFLGWKYRRLPPTSLLLSTIYALQSEKDRYLEYSTANMGCIWDVFLNSKRRSMPKTKWVTVKTVLKQVAKLHFAVKRRFWLYDFCFSSSYWSQLVGDIEVIWNYLPETVHVYLDSLKTTKVLLFDSFLQKLHSFCQ